MTLHNLQRSGARYRVFPGCKRMQVGELVLPAGAELILPRLIAGQSNKEIAIAVGVEELHIKEFVRRMGRAVGTRNRVQVAVWALRNGFSEEDVGE